MVVFQRGIHESLSSAHHEPVCPSFLDNLASGFAKAAAKVRQKNGTRKVLLKKCRKNFVFVLESRTFAFVEHIINDRNMKKLFFPMMLMTSVLTLSASCNNKANASTANVAADSIAPGDITQAPKPEGEVICYVVNGNYQDAVAVFAVEKTEGTLTASMDGEEWKTLYDLRLVSYKEANREETANAEEGGREVQTYGTLIVNAYDPQTGAYVGQFSGEFDDSKGYDVNGEQEWGSQSYISKFAKVDGTVEDVEFYGD